MRPLRLLFCWSAAEFSTFDVARGYSKALRRQGHEVYDFRLYNRIKYHGLALRNDPLGPKLSTDSELISRLAAEGMVVEALRFRVDLVIAISAMGLHPDGLELLTRAGFPIALIFTEAPYDDAWHQRFARHAAHLFVNERSSAREHGWTYLAAAYDPEIHRPLAPHGRRCDALIVGTGWPERQALLEAVSWDRIDLRVVGWWQGIRRRSPLRRFYEPGPIDNELAVELYSSAKVCVNQHRGFEGAESLNPRAFELAACGAYQVSDRRSELADVFGATVPTYGSAAELEVLIREALLLPRRERRARAEQQRAKLLSGGHTFDERAATLMAAITNSGGEDDGPVARQERPFVHTGGAG